MEKKVLRMNVDNYDEYYEDGDFKASAVNIGHKNETIVRELLKADDGEIYIEYKDINHNDTKKRFLLELYESHRGEDLTPSGLNTTKAKLYLFRFLNWRGDRKVIPMFTHWFEGTKMFGAIGNDELTTKTGQFKVNLNIPFISMIRYILIEVFGLREGVHFTLNDELLKDE